jgi:hypothetical protein
MKGATTTKLADHAEISWDYLAKFHAGLRRLAEVAHLQLPDDWNW